MSCLQAGWNREKLCLVGIIFGGPAKKTSCLVSIEVEPGCPETRQDFFSRARRSSCRQDTCCVCRQEICSVCRQDICCVCGQEICGLPRHPNGMGDRGGPPSAAPFVVNRIGVSWQTADFLSVDTTDFLSADTTDFLSTDTTDVLSANTTVLFLF